MHIRCGLIAVAIWTSLLPCGALAQQSVPWQPTLESAKRLAADTNRLVLIHFWAEWCTMCTRMEREVLSRPEVIAAVQADYVPVKINHDYFPATCRQYGITALPSDIIITPQGHLLERFQGMSAAAQFAARLNQVANTARGAGGGVYAQVPVAPARNNMAPVGSPNMQRDNRTADNVDPSANRYSDNRYTDDRYADYHRKQSNQPALRQLPAGSPPLGLGGCCPVQLSDDMSNNRLQWTQGDPRWGAYHRGRTYLFAGPRQQQRFMSDPDRYAPVNSGNDVVLAIEQGRAVAGQRKHGVSFGGRVFLFADETSLEKFSETPDRYANQALQAMRMGPGISSRTR